MAIFKLSYAITTRNKLPNLRQVMRRLLDNLQDDEEIVVADGASTDGTVDYLRELCEQGKIHQFISEPDKGEAHGYNKSFLMARGELIKPITDDDAYYYPGIQKCKKFMLEHKDIDILFSNTGLSASDMLNRNLVHDATYVDQYNQWLSTRKVFIFNGLGIMARRSSTPLLGLLATDFTLADNEMSLRFCKIANMALYTGYLAVNIHNKDSKPRPKEKVAEEFRRLEAFYDWELPEREKRIVHPPRKGISEFVMSVIKNRFTRAVKRRLFPKPKVNHNTDSTPVADLLFADLLLRAERWLKEKNEMEGIPLKILFKE
jgi:glycosyltransferase involved in cell wall biosynthesis